LHISRTKVILSQEKAQAVHIFIGISPGNIV